MSVKREEIRQIDKSPIYSARRSANLRIRAKVRKNTLHRPFLPLWPVRRRRWLGGRYVVGHIIVVNASGHFVLVVGAAAAIAKNASNPQHKAWTDGFSPLGRVPVCLGHPKSTQVLEIKQKLSKSSVKIQCLKASPQSSVKSQLCAHNDAQPFFRDLAPHQAENPQTTCASSGSLYTFVTYIHPRVWPW